MKLDFSKVKAAAEKVTDELEGEQIDNLSTLLGEFGHELGKFNENNSHNFRYKTVLTVIEEAAKGMTGGFDTIKKSIETASKNLADKQIKEILVTELEACIASVETMLGKPKTPTTAPAGAMTDKQCLA